MAGKKGKTKTKELDDSVAGILLCGFWLSCFIKLCCFGVQSMFSLKCRESQKLDTTETGLTLRAAVAAVAESRRSPAAGSPRRLGGQTDRLTLNKSRT